jgi:acyl-CoA reductase-like NAD-dependent aldehyde dehydrogenase
VAGGARIILGGKRPSADSAFFEPTILTNVEKGTPAYDEELFGPVAAVMTVPDEETAIAIAERGRRVADQIDAGMVYVNHPAWIYEDILSAAQEIGIRSRNGTARHTGVREQEALSRAGHRRKKFLIVPDLHNPLL